MDSLLDWVAFLIWMGVLLVVLHRLLRRHSHRSGHRAIHQTTPIGQRPKPSPPRPDQ